MDSVSNNPRIKSRNTRARPQYGRVWNIFWWW